MGRQESQFEDRIRSIEQVFEAALERTDGGTLGDDVVPSDLRKEIIEQRFGEATPDVDFPYKGKYSRCIAFLSTVCASLSAKKVGDISGEQMDVLRRVYRFVTGPVRECARRFDPATDLEITEIHIDRLVSEMHHLSTEVREADLLAPEHTYS